MQFSAITYSTGLLLLGCHELSRILQGRPRGTVVPIPPLWTARGRRMLASSLYTFGQVELAPVPPLLGQVIRTQELAHPQHVGSGDALEGPGVLVVAFSLFLIFPHLLQSLTAHGVRWEGQLVGNLVKETSYLLELTASAHLHDETAGLHGRHVVIDGTFASPHALSHALARDGLERGWHSPYGKHVLGVHSTVDRQAHHFKVAPVEVATTQCLSERRNKKHGDFDEQYKWR